MKKTVFNRFYSQLAQALPMNDVSFTAALYSANEHSNMLDEQ